MDRSRRTTIRPLFACAVLAFSITCPSARALATGSSTDAERYAEYWAPKGIRPTTESLAAVLTRVTSRAIREPASRTDRYTLTSGDTPYAVTASVLGYNYAIATTIAGFPVRIGRHGGMRWRANGNTVHDIRADVQGDDFDRWPVAALGFDPADCTLAGTATIPAPAWVLLDQPALDIPRWLYVDQTSGDIVREVSREGGRVVTYDLENAGATGERYPAAWTISGSGGAATVALVTSDPGNVGVADVARPTQGPPSFSEPASPHHLNAQMTTYRAFMVRVRVNGKNEVFQLDSGTPELILGKYATGAAGGSHLAHGVASALDVDGSISNDARYREVGFWEDGLLGYDFFRGRIVHVDYPNGRIDVLPREGFVPPRDALALPTDWTEGMPIVTGRIGDTVGSRFAIDLGSHNVLIMRQFAEAAKLTPYGATRHDGFLEGPVAMRPVELPDFIVGRVRIINVPGMVEVADADNLDIPLDGIIGTDQLASFEWWFDADGPMTYFRYGT